MKGCESGMLLRDSDSCRACDYTAWVKAKCLVEPEHRGERCVPLSPNLPIATGLRVATGWQRNIILEGNMDWNRVEGSWKQVKGAVKEKWGKLTDDDLDVINGKRDQLEGKPQERYGFAKDQVRKDVDSWYSSQKW